MMVTFAALPTRTAVKTANYTAAPDNLVPVDTATPNANVTVTLPTAPPANTRITVKHIAVGSGKSAIIACGAGDFFNKASGPTSISLTLLNQSVTVQYDAPTKVWTALQDDISVLNAAYQMVVTAGSGETASATTIRLNAALAAVSVFGVRKVVTLVGDFTINAPLVIPSNTALDARSATITLAPGSNCAMLNNASMSAAQRTFADAATTAGSTTVTSATANFTSADIGRSLYLTGASANGMVLCATITAVTNATTVTISKAAGLTLTGVSASVYNRDTNITVRGGQWNRGTNDGTGLAHTNLTFRRVDKLSIEALEVTSGSGKYAIFPADVTQLRVSDIQFNTASDGVHLQGPITGAIVSGITGFTGDDVVAIGNSDLEFPDTFGDMIDVIVDGVAAQCTAPTALVKIYGVAGVGGTHGAANAAAGSVFRNLIIRNVVGGNATGGPLLVVETDPVIDDLTVDSVSGEANGTLVRLMCASAGTIELSRLRATALAGVTPALVVTDASAGSVNITNLIVRDSLLKTATTDAAIAYLFSGTTISKLRFNGCTLEAAGATSPRGMARVYCTVTRAEVANCFHNSGNNGTSFHVTSTGNVTTLVLIGNEHTSASNGSGSFVLADSGATLSKVYYYGNIVTGAYAGIADLNGTTTELHVFGHSCGGASWVPDLHVSSTANVKLFGDGQFAVSGTFGLVDSGGVLRVNHRGAPIDLSIITSRTAGDIAYNTNAAIVPGVGPAIWDGSAWRSVMTGALKTGTVTLVAGTATVANTAITANSVIRVANKTAGGTVGAPYVSARSAGTSFTITSTSGADTSVVQYDVLAY